MATYRGGELGRLSGLSALLSNWRQGRVEGGDVVCSEATLERAAGIVGSAKVGAERGAQRGGEAEGSKRRVFAGGAQAAAVADTGGEGHGQLEIHCAAVSACPSRRGHVRVGGSGRYGAGGAKRQRRAAGTQGSWAPTCTTQGRSNYSYRYTGRGPSSLVGCVVQGSSSGSNSSSSSGCE